MASPNNQTIPIIVKSTDHGYNCAYVITQGDANAYTLTITYTDITAFDGTVTLRFVMPDGTYHDRDDSDGVAVSGNKITYTMAEADYAQRGMVCYVRHLDSTTIHTTLKVTFSQIRALEGETAGTETVSYPQWVADMRDFDVAIGTVETLAPGADATASITGDVPDKVLNLGIPVGATGAQGTQGDKGDPNTLSIGSVYTLAPTEPATATITGTSPNQTLSLGIPKGDKGDKGDAGPNTVTTTTATNLTGVIAGDGANIRAATATDGDSLPVTGGTLGAQLSAIEDVALSRQLKYWNRPAAYKIKVAAGRFNMLWDNASGRMWVFPAGTVEYSDGITPIRTSTDGKPDVIIPAGGGYVWLVSAMWNGQYTLRSYDTSAILTSALADLPSLTDTLRLDDCSLITGDLADLPPLTYYLSLSGCSQVTGDLADLPPVTNTLDLTNCEFVTGDLADLPPLTYRLNLSNCSQVTGDLADLPPLTNTLDLSNCSQVTGAYTAVNGDNVPKTTILTGTGVSSTDMDATLIAYAACTKDNGKFTATGKTRTAASDAAVATLSGRGWTISEITKA